MLITEASSAGQICVVKAHGELPTYKLWTELWYEKSMVPVAGMVTGCPKHTESAKEQSERADHRGGCACKAHDDLR